jgi:hypothetical protein
MSRPKAQLRCRFAYVLAGALFWTAAIEAQTGNGFSSGTNQAPALAFTPLPGELVGHEQVVRELIKSGTNEFMFVVPEGLRIEAPREGRLLLISPDLKWYVSIRIVEPPPANLALKQVLREQIAARYPGASSLEEFAATVAEQGGSGFQLWQKLPGLGPRRISILWVPFRAGILEFALNTDSDSASASRGALDMILLTFRSNERGKIEIVRRPDKT